jgi:flagellar motor switch protein FliN/FliY
MTMSDGSLSQDEIDALLQGTGGVDFDSGPRVAALTDAQVDQFRQLVNGTVSTQQSNLSVLVSNEVQIAEPTVDLVDGEQLIGALPGSVVAIHIDFSEGVPGRHVYLLSDGAAIQIAGPMMGQDGVELDDAAVNALQEAFSQVSGPLITALGDQAGTTVMNNPPSGSHGSPVSVDLPSGDLVKVTYSVTIAGGAPVEIHELFEAGVITAALGGAAAAAPAAAAEDPMAGLLAGASAAGPAPAAPAGGGFSDMSLGSMGVGASPSVQSVQFPNLSAAGGGTEQGNIGLLMDVFMEMTVELGRTRKLIKEILGMGEGTIIELDKLAGEPVDILVNHKLIAKGEVVVIDENFGVRVTEIVSPMERMGNTLP